MKKINQENALVILSGGQDSTTCLAWAIARWGIEHVRSITFQYGQRHENEIGQAKKVADMLGVNNTIVQTGLITRLAESALLSAVTDINSTVDELPASFVPGRNVFFLLCACIYAYRLDYGNIVLGANQTDYSGYPDCRRANLDVVMAGLNLCVETDLRLFTPLMNLSKAETFKMADELGILEIILEHTMTCYNGCEVRNAWGMGCGHCPACELRRNGFYEYNRSRASV